MFNKTRRDIIRNKNIREEYNATGLDEHITDWMNE